MGFTDYILHSWFSILILCICIIFIVLWTTIWDSEKLKQELKDVSKDNGTIDEVYTKYEKIYSDNETKFKDNLKAEMENTAQDEKYYKKCALDLDYKSKESKEDILINKIKINENSRFWSLFFSSGFGAGSLAYILYNTRNKYNKEKKDKK